MRADRVDARERDDRPQDEVLAGRAGDGCDFLSVSGTGIEVCGFPAVTPRIGLAKTSFSFFRTPNRLRRALASCTRFGRLESQVVTSSRVT